MLDPDEIICFCTLLTRRQIAAVLAQTLDFDKVVRLSGACTGCGSCQTDVEEMIQEAAKGNLDPLQNMLLP